jgi:hypothetical protein
MEKMSGESVVFQQLLFMEKMSGEYYFSVSGELNQRLLTPVCNQVMFITG